MSLVSEALAVLFIRVMAKIEGNGKVRVDSFSDKGDLDDTAREYACQAMNTLIG